MDLDPSLLSLEIDEAAIDREIERRRTRDSFAEFVKRAWPIFDQSPLKWGWPMDALCSHYEAVAREEIHRLAINQPPRSAKSNIGAILFPAWAWTWNPRIQFFYLSYAAELSVEHSVKCRQVIESDWYQETHAKVGGWRLCDDQNVKHDFANTAGGRRRATSITGSITGRGGDIIVIDDPLNADDAYSKAKRDEAKRVVSEAISTRLNDPKTGRVVMVMQRLHEEDPMCVVDKDWQQLVLPTEFEPERKCVTHRTVKKVNGHTEYVQERWEDPRTQPGELLFPERYSLESLAVIKRTLGPFGYAGQHQQRPAPEGGGIFKVENWRFWKADDTTMQRLGYGSGMRPRGCYTGPANPLIIDELEELLLSVDATFKETADGSFVAIHVWGRLKNRRCLLDRVHARMDFTDTVKSLLAIIARWPKARRKLIEGKANGDAIISTLQRTHGVTGLEAVSPGTASKEQRAHAMQSFQSAGDVELPEGAAWLGEYIAEHAACPNGAHDDDIDAQSQALQGFEKPVTTAALWANAFKNGRVI